jgi:hypothetical protein
LTDYGGDKVKMRYPIVGSEPGICGKMVYEKLRRP